MTLPGIEIVQLAGRQVEIRQAGSGPVLFLLHGIGSASRGWIHQFPAFADRCRVVAWGAPGYGRSSDIDSETPAPHDYALILRDLFDALEIGRAILCGNSLGALFSAAFAKIAPERVAGLFLSDAAQGHGRLSEAEREAKLRARLEPLDRLGVEGMAQARAGNLLAPGVPEELRDTVAGITAEIRPVGYRRAAWALSVGDLMAEIADYGGPMAVVCGEEDRVTPPDTNREIAASRPQASFTLIPGAGHLPYIEQPDPFNALLAGFVDPLTEAAR